MTNKPLVSVLITAYNREEYISDAIKSVLSSTYTNFELIISDDCSKDNTVELAKSFEKLDHRVKVYQNKVNLGDYPNRNQAASYAIGKYIKYLDSDDIMYPHCLDVMVYCMEQFPAAGFGLCAVGDETTPYPVSISSYECYQNLILEKGELNRAPGSSIINRYIFNEIGGFSGIRQIGDFEFWLKIASRYPLVKMPLDLYWSRLHSATEKNVNSEKEKTIMKHELIKKLIKSEALPLNKEEKEKLIEVYRNNFFDRMKRRIKW